MSAMITIANFLTVPLVILIPIVGIRQLMCAFPQGLLLTLGVLKVRKSGSILIMSLLTGLVLLPMSWIMTAMNVVSGALCEVFIILIFKNFKSDRAVVSGASLFNPLTIPSSFFITIWISEYLADFLADPILVVIMFFLCLIVSSLGSLCGLKIGEVLKKAGKLS